MILFSICIHYNQKFASKGKGAERNEKDWDQKLLYIVSEQPQKKEYISCSKEKLLFGVFYLRITWNKHIRVESYR